MLIIDEKFYNYPFEELDSTLWEKVVAGHGFGNNELQYYTLNEKNCFIDSEGLHLVAYKEKYKNRNYTSARIFTKKCFKYGKISFEIKLPKNYGIWPAIWLLSEEIRTKRNWPECGEIDLMEFVGRLPKVSHFSLHCKDFNHVLNNHRTKLIDLNDNEFHKYVIYWTYDGFSMELDGEKIELFKRPLDAKKSNWPFDENYFVIMNLAVGGYFPDNPKEDFIKDEFIIKYLKVESLENEN